MMRTRLVWFTIGFASTAAAMSHFIAKDVWAGSRLVSSQLKKEFGDLDARVSKLEIASTASPHQD